MIDPVSGARNRAERAPITCGGMIGDNGGDIRNCAASGDVTDRNQIGLLVGRNYGSPIDNSMGTGTLT